MRFMTSSLNEIAGRKLRKFPIPRNDNAGRRRETRRNDSVAAFATGRRKRSVGGLGFDLGVLDQDRKVVSGPQIDVGLHRATDHHGGARENGCLGGDHQIAAALRAGAVREMDPGLAHDVGGDLHHPSANLDCLALVLRRVAEEFGNGRVGLGHRAGLGRFDLAGQLGRSGDSGVGIMGQRLAALGAEAADEVDLVELALEGGRFEVDHFQAGPALEGISDNDLSLGSSKPDSSLVGCVEQHVGIAAGVHRFDDGALALGQGGERKQQQGAGSADDPGLLGHDGVLGKRDAARGGTARVRRENHTLDPDRRPPVALCWAPAARPRTRRPLTMRRISLVVLVLLLFGFAASLAAPSHLMRHADVHGERIVFTYEGDLWLVPTEGGAARRITRHPGVESYASFSPDGRQLAFTASYDGGVDVYVMPAEGGEPRRLTWHPADDRVIGWTPDGDEVLFRSRREYPFRGEQVYAVSIAGGLPRKLPVDRAGLASISPDGRSIAYNRISREDRTWKRHQGGTAQEIWVGSLAERKYRPITDWEGTDNYPMWHDRFIYFTSDRRHGTLNIFRYDTENRVTEAVTDYADYDVKYPALGPAKIVFQYAESLHLLDLDSGQVRAVPVEMPSDRTPVRHFWTDASKRTGGYGLSPDGSKLLLDTRGEIVSVPVEEGEASFLAAASRSREKNPLWSPDGKYVAFVSDRSGEEQIYLVPAEGGEARQLTRRGEGFLLPAVWSPDSRYLLYSDKQMRLNLLEVTSGELRVIDQGDYDDAWERWGIQDYVFSPDSRTIAYSKMEGTLNESIFLYSIDEGKIHRLTGADTPDWSPTFDPSGRYLYFLSQRTFHPIMGRVDQNHVFLDMTRPYLVVLESGRPTPFAPAASGEETKEEDDEGQVGSPPVKIDYQGLERRIVAVEGIEAGNYFRLEALDDGLLFVSRPKPIFLKYQNITDANRDGLDLLHYDLEEKTVETVASGVFNYHLSADRRKLVYQSAGGFTVIDAGKKPGGDAVEVDLESVRFQVDRRAEFEQIFDEAWRVQRDWFFDPGLHGVDWEAIGRKYRRFVSDCGNRADLNYLIGEMIGELNIGHTYIFGGETGPQPERIPVGLLGVDWQRPAG
ncbi:MAG TPA: hypothetical protein ENK10_05015, partial [Acidobacteria bacterium]|nr:hypothetical protein [Acidobacteriota bacterium]